VIVALFEPCVVALDGDVRRVLLGVKLNVKAPGLMVSLMGKVDDVDWVYVDSAS
jgi:hypothetical protein